VTTETNGIILLNKTAGLTSFKALGSLKKALRDYSGSKVKIGHTGTLDSFAEGLLVILSGRFTKLNPVFTGFNKTYEADIVFGTRTNTLDPGGEVVENLPVPELNEIEKHIPLFKGVIKQRPPLFSAVHVNGERAYKKALQGTITELPERDIRIDAFDILDWRPPVLKCRIACSKGTYIRSIARDLGIAAGSCAHLGALTRLSVGPFNIEDSVYAADFKPGKDLISGRDVFLKLSAVHPEQFGIIEARDEGVRLLRHGADIDDSFFIEEPAVNGSYAVFNDNDFIAYISYMDGRYSYNFVGCI